MTYSDEPFLDSPSTPPRRGVRSGVVFGVLAVGIVLGFTLGLFFSDWLGRGPDGSSALFNEKLVTSLFEKASPTVVEIRVSRGSGLGLQDTNTGSGFLVDTDGHIVTNEHVVQGAGDITVRLFDGRTLEAVKLGTSPADDLALIAVDPGQVADIKPLPLADSSEVKPGQLAVAIGSPFRQLNSVTVGVVSGTGRGPVGVLRRPIPDMIQTDAPLNSGNSGGPLLNSKGQVIGVNSSVQTGQFQGLEDYRIGFAVPSNTVRDLMPALLNSEQVRRPWLGISGRSVRRDLAATSELPSGIYVDSVFPGSPAEDAGLLPSFTRRGANNGDVITAVDGKATDSVEDMVSYFNGLNPGDSVTLSVVRGGQRLEVDVTLVEWPDS